MDAPGNQASPEFPARQLLELAEALGQPAVVLNPAGRVLACNDGFCRTHGISAEALRDQPLREILPSLAAWEIGAALEQGLRGSGTFTAGPSVVSQFMETVVISFGDGLLLMHVDRAERRRLDDEHWQLIDSLAHAFRTPLSSIRGYAETICLDETADVARMREYVGHIQRLSLHLNRIVSDLLFISRLERGGYHEPVSAVGLGRIVRDVVDAWEDAAQAAGVDICIVEEAVGISVLAGESALREICYNLLDNAVKYSPAGGSVTIGIARRDETVLLEVADCGIGIAADELPHVFKRFFRAAQARSGNYQGAGLGLCKVRGVVELLGGSIEISSTVGQGTLVSVRLPSA